MDVGAWLRGLGLGEYEAKFRDNRIDGDVLLRLTVDDLRDVGVVAVGDRRRLLAAIVALKESAELTASSASPARLIAQLSAERRPVTVMFCDLVGSTGLAARLDAEDWRNLVNTYLDNASDAVAGLGGHVLKRLGDGLMALFGYPRAQENDAERAVQAALAIQRAIAEINQRNSGCGSPELSARIGLESGLAIVDSAGEVFGEAPNVAARVQAVAEPGTVLITSTVQRQVAGLFIVEHKGAHELRGVPAPVTLYRILRVSGGRRRKGARVLTPFVGREEDLAVLARKWARVVRGEGQFVLIAGEPGIGKSRLVEEFRARLGETPHTWIEWNSSQLLQNTPLHPIAAWGRARFGGPEVPPERRLAELESILVQVDLDPAENSALLAPLADIPIPPERLPNRPPDDVRRDQLSALVTWALAGAKHQPIVLLFEDLQWADPSSIDLVQALSERCSEAPLLFLATARPEFRPHWGLRSHHCVISLTPLDVTQVASMVQQLASERALAADVVKSLSERAGGVPLFVEEVTRLLLERGEQRDPHAIPPTLQQSLAARLDRLGSSREAAQIGAILGREFSYSLLRAVTEVDEQTLQAALERLADADILFVEGTSADASYRFKHALIQDAAYDSLLRSRRQALHRRAAEALIDAGGEPEEIAHHFNEAGFDDSAAEWWGKAGEDALHRSAYKEAVAHLGKAIAIADKIEGSAATSRRLKLQTAYGQAVMWSKGFASDEASVVYARVGELAVESGASEQHNVVYYAEWIRAFIRGEITLARQRIELLLREAEGLGHSTDAVVAHRTLGLTCLFQGDLLLARRHLEQAMSDYVPERDMVARRLFGTDPGITSKTFLALLMWLIGELDSGRQLIDHAIKAGEETGHVGMISTNQLFLVRFEINRDDPTRALRAAEALLTFARAHDIALYVTYGEIFTTWARGRLSSPEAAACELRRMVSDYLAFGNKNSAPIFHCLIADLEALAGRGDSALASIDLALASAEETGERWSDSVLYRRRGEILLKRQSYNLTAIENAFQSAIAVAKNQGARSYELLAALSLAKFYHSTGRRAEARAVLEPSLDGFTPTSEMPEIAEARALIEILA
jgi:class 3 adenylate cyclase/tetratricopeptide (TPR) repeat protein